MKSVHDAIRTDLLCPITGEFRKVHVIDYVQGCCNRLLLSEYGVSPFDPRLENVSPTGWISACQLEKLGYTVYIPADIDHIMGKLTVQERDAVGLHFAEKYNKQ